MKTAAKWAARVAAWRASGQSAPVFAEGKEFQASTLRYWASRLRRADTPEPKPEVRIARLVRTTDAPGETPIVIELGGARVGVRRGFDRGALSAVLDALAERKVAE